MISGVSVIVCCYNSSGRLPETIKHLALQIVPDDIPWEVILVDNASTDSTSVIASSEWSKYNISNVSFRVLSQPLAGLAYAKEMGINTANYEYLLFCDDDNWLNDNYVALAYRIMDADKHLGALGGMGIAIAEQPAKLDKKLINKLTANGPQTWAETDHWVYGAGSLYRKSILVDLKKKGWQQITTGRKGTSLISGEDAEICFMIYLNGYKVESDNRLIFKHFVALGKQSDNFRLKMAFGLSYSYFLMYSYLVIINKEKASLKRVCKDLFLNHSVALIKQILKRAYGKLVTGKTSSIEDKALIQQHYGMITSIYKNTNKVIKHNTHLRNLLDINSLNNV